MKNEIVFPKNRKEVFLVLIKYHKLSLLKINLWIALFSLLTLLAIYFGIFVIAQVPSLISNGTIEMVKEGDLDYSVLFTSVSYLIALFLVLIVTNIPLFLGVGGGIYVISLLCYGESNVLITKDFFNGIKRNAKEMILLSLIFSIASLFMIAIFGIYLLMDTFLIVKVISNIIGVLVFLIVSIVTFVGLNYANTYKSSFLKLLRNSFLIAFSKPLKTIGFLLLASVFFLLLFIPIRIPIFSLLVIFVGYSYFLVIEFLYTSSLFDEYINKKAHIELVGKGIKKD
ncbi:MAG: hypothetical protein IJ656_03340 [Bacilli bacterium]|nr:hypothetical protein [Bacilli bacterium]MBR1582047.1 hypothetical protein [Bacilli bacterium]